MSAIRERTVLCLVNLPRTLTSRRNLHAYFSKFGEVKTVSVNKDLKSGIVQFSTHFEAQSAKHQGQIYEGEPLSIFWSEAATLDPRAKQKQDTEIRNADELWEGDDGNKEYFGVASHQTNAREDRKQSAKDLIKQHLTTPIKLGVKQRVGLASKTSTAKKVDELDSKPIVKHGKIGSKNLVIKKSTINPTMKRNIIRKDKDTLQSVGSKQKKSIIKQLPKSKSTTVDEKTDLKHKLAMLDERDKLIRKDTVQDSNIKTAVAIKGTCPDMCPERERILRQIGQAVATYEMKPGTNDMDESRAVKEYTRSSADQEVPLPHDLRPEPVLSMTMNYLITNIMNRVDNTEENKAVWYSFCWNRLRSIRKDIILQQLCNMETVTIVEQCARFHICCYDHMWGAEISGFDDKINTQNVIDCLQTLKHLYEDLAERGVTCPNEPEFYLYLILLKLETGDIMWEYQQYPLHVQLSPQVQFGIETYMAFKNNMYSRYFSLVNKASYLTACLMQRYFDEVRTQALRTMLKAYLLPNKNVGLSSSFIASALKFDSQKAALRFCEHEEVDIKVDSDDNEDDSYLSTSSFLIREKRLPIASAIAGGNIPVVTPPQVNSSFDTPPQVHSSFDGFGKLKSSTIEGLQDDEDLNVIEVLTYKKEEDEDITVPVETKQSTFKFSLSPTKSPENIFGQTLFSTKKDTDNHPSTKDFMNQDFIENTGDISMNYNYAALNSLGVQQDLDQDMVCEDIEMQQEPVSMVSYQTIPVKSENEIQGFKNSQQSFSISSPVSAKEQIVWPKGKENKGNNEFEQHYKPFSNIQYLSSQTENKQTSFSFSLSKSEHPKQFLDSSSNNKKDLPLTLYNKEPIPHLENNIFTKESIKHQKQIDCKDFSTLPNVDLNLSANKQMSQVADEKLTETRGGSEKENEFRSLLLEKLLKEEAEQKRLQLEEKIRLEQIRKKNEEKKKNDYLRKYVRQRFKVITARKYARQWREKIEKLKNTRADFPSLIQLSVEDHLSKWGFINSIPTNNIFLRARDQIRTVRITSQLLHSGISDSCRYIGSDLAECLAKSATKTMKKGSTRAVFWKLGISVPWVGDHSSDLSVFSQLMRRWCKQSFYKQESSCLGSVEQVKTSLEIPVNLSIHLSDTLQSSQHLKGMDALIFVVLNDIESEKGCCQRLQTVMSNKMKNCEFSIAVMNIGGNKLEKALEIELQELYEQNIVAHWKICSWSQPKSIVQSLHFLADKINVVPHICVSLLEVLVREMSDEFFDALTCSQNSVEEFRNAMRSPNSVIYVYNMCLSKLEALLMSSQLERYFNVAEEFKTHVTETELGGPELLCGKHYNDAYRTQVTKLMNSLKLPEFSQWPIGSTNRLLKWMKAYCQQVEGHSVFPQIIRMLDIPEDVDLHQHLEQVSWLNIVEVWAHCRVQHTFSTTDKSNRLFVVFDKNNVQRLIQNQWWLKLPSVVQRN